MSNANRSLVSFAFIDIDIDMSIYCFTDCTIIIERLIRTVFERHILGFIFVILTNRLVLNDFIVFNLTLIIRQFKKIHFVGLK